MVDLDVKIQCLLQSRLSDWLILKELSQLDRATASAVAAAWISIVDKHYERYIPQVGEHGEGTLTPPILPRRDAPAKYWKRTYAKLYWYIREGSFYRMKDPTDVLWRYLAPTPQVYERHPDLHLWRNILFMSVRDVRGASYVRVFDCNRLD